MHPTLLSHVDLLIDRNALRLYACWFFYEELEEESSYEVFGFSSFVFQGLLGLTSELWSCWSCTSENCILQVSHTVMTRCEDLVRYISRSEVKQLFPCPFHERIAAYLHIKFEDFSKRWKAKILPHHNISGCSSSKISVGKIVCNEEYSVFILWRCGRDWCFFFLTWLCST